MSLRLGSFAALAVSLLGLSLLSSPKAYTQGPGKNVTKKLVDVILDDNEVKVEGKYAGAQKRGGGLMTCLAVWQCHNSFNNETWTVFENVTLQAEWDIDDGNIYWVEQGWTLFPEGLYVDPDYISVGSGTTGVTAVYQGIMASGTIKVLNPWVP